MQERGRLQPGMIADITIFNPDTISDTSTMKMGERGSYTRGIPYVLVNGQVMIDDGVANTKLRAGQPIRYAVITEGKIPEEIDLNDKKYQWHSDLPGYPATRFPPQKMKPPSPNELERKQTSQHQHHEDVLHSFACPLHYSPQHARSSEKHDHTHDEHTHDHQHKVQLTAVHQLHVSATVTN